MVIYCDTDCLTFAIAGDLTKPITQGFSQITTNQELYDKEKYLYLPNPELGIKDEKKLLGFAVENIGDEMIALAPKSYALHRLEKGKWNWKIGMKGCDKKRKPQVNHEAFKKCLNNEKIYAQNCGLYVRGSITTGKYELQKDTVNKIALSGIHLKGVYLSNQHICPFIHGKSSPDYSTC
jgi:hypothetical protein